MFEAHAGIGFGMGVSAKPPETTDKIYDFELPSIAAGDVGMIELSGISSRQALGIFV